ncbi:MAG: hypothetical protein D3908_07185, partial [Candidatus Electrothrix sp. AUS4]|nr:hypothetical protein [Candidatus Electrothrix sp. AUS4]
KIYLLYNLIEKDTVVIMGLIEQAVQKNLLEYSLRDRGLIQFAHDRIREAFLAKISGEDRQEYHLKISRFLLKEYKGKEDEILFELTYHLMEGGDEEKGVEYALRAGAEARTNHAHQDAITYYIFVKEILHKRGDKSEKYVGLLENLGESYRLTLHFERSLELLKECNKLISNEQTVRKSKVLSKIGDTLFEKGEVEKSFHALEQALKLLGIKVPQSKLAIHIGLLTELGKQMLHTWFPNFFLSATKLETPNDDVVILRALNRLYKWYFFQDVKKSLYCHLKCLNLAEKMPPCSELIHCYVLGGVIWASIPWESNSLRYATLGINTAITTGDKIQEGAAYAGVSLASLILNRPSEGLEYSKKSINILKGLGEYWDLGVAYAFRIQNCLLTGKINEALVVSEEFIALSSEAKALQNLGWALIGKGKSIFLIRNASENEINEVKKGYLLMKETRDVANMLLSLSTLASLYLRKREYIKSIKTIEEVARLFPSHYSNGAWILDLFPLGAQIYLDSILNISELTSKDKQEYFRRARWFCKKSFKWSKKFKFIEGWAHQVNGTYNWLIGRRKKAIHHWETGITFLREQTEDTYRQGYLLMEAGSFLLHATDTSHQEKAKKYLQQAQKLFKEIGALTDYKKALSISGIKEPSRLEQEGF